MKLKGITYEDFVNYKKPSMFIVFPYCTFKCDRENGVQLCQNSSLIKEKTYDIHKKDIVDDYLSNPITEAFVFGGLEPFMSGTDLMLLVDYIRSKRGCNDDIVIYTGYTEDELEGKVEIAESGLICPIWREIKQYKNIIVKFGRFRPDQEPHYDGILGINLISDNQYAKRFNYEN